MLLHSSARAALLILPSTAYLDTAYLETAYLEIASLDTAYLEIASLDTAYLDGVSHRITAGTGYNLTDHFNDLNLLVKMATLSNPLASASACRDHLADIIIYN